MAKKKEVVASSDAEDFTQRVCREIDADYGDGVLVSGTEVGDVKKMLIPVSPALDIILGGGIEEGSWVGVTGPPKSVKTGTLLSFAATCQKPEYGSRPVYYGKVEGRLSSVVLKGTAGLDLSRLNVIQSCEGRILSAQDHLRIYTNILKTVPGAVLIIDSISSLCDERELTDGVGTETRGGGAKLFSQFLNITSNVVPVNRCIVLGITHLISNTSGFGPHRVEKGAVRWQYQCDYQLRTVAKEDWVAGNKKIGFKVTWKCFTNPLGVPGMQTESYVRFGTGVDRLYEAFTFGLACGLVRKAGAWYYLDYLAEEKYKHLLAGGETPKGYANICYGLLEQHPEWAQALEREVVARGSGLRIEEES